MPTLTGAPVPHLPDTPPSDQVNTTYGYPALGPSGGMYLRMLDEGSQSSGLAGGTTVLRYLNPFRWFGTTITYINETRRFNDFRLQRVPTLETEETEERRTGERRERSEGGWCWTEEQVIRTRYRVPRYIEEQRYEVWTINQTKESYYAFLTGGGGVAVDVAIDGAAALQAAGAMELSSMAAGASGTWLGAELSASAAATAASAQAFALVGWGVLCFQGTTAAWVYSQGGATNAAGEMTHSGWDFHRRVLGARERISEHAEWDVVVPRHPCESPHMDPPRTEPPRVRTGGGEGSVITPGGRILSSGPMMMLIGLIGLLLLALGATILILRAGSGDGAVGTTSVSATAAPGETAPPGETAAGVPAAWDTEAGPGKVRIYRLDGVDYVAEGIQTVGAHPGFCEYEHVHGGPITALLPDGSGSFPTRGERDPECGFGPPNFFVVDDPR